MVAAACYAGPHGDPLNTSCDVTIDYLGESIDLDKVGFTDMEEPWTLRKAAAVAATRITKPAVVARLPLRLEGRRRQAAHAIDQAHRRRLAHPHGVFDMSLHHGDCLDIMPTLEAGSIDLVLTDPPYGTTACKWDSVIPLEPMWDNLKRLIKPNAAIVMTASQPFTTTLIASNMKMFKYCWVWDKKRPSNPMLAKVRTLKVHEDICVFYRAFGTYNPQGLIKTDGKPRGGTSPSKTELGFGRAAQKNYKQTHTNYPKSIQVFGTDNSKNLHPTQKPVALMEYLIKTYTNEGDTVLDFTMGSGTTGVACENLGRNFIGIEKDAGYFKIASERIEGHTI